MRQRSIQLYFLLLVFFGPLLVAAVIFYGPWEWTQNTDAANGEFLNPPLQLPLAAMTTVSGIDTSDDWLLYRWSLIYARTAACDGSCVERLNRLNQVRIALGKDLGRAQVVLLFAGAAPPLPSGADVIAVRLDDAAGGALLELLGEQAIRDGRIYLSDPRGLLIMTYPPDVEQKAILEDLERLMTFSAIG